VILGRVSAEPPHGCAVVLRLRVVADEQDEAESVGQVDVAELGRQLTRPAPIPPANPTGTITPAT